MEENKFQALVKLVLQSKNPPPADIFAAGENDWHVRARLAHFLGLPEFKQAGAAIELLQSVTDAAVDNASSEDIEEKIYALQKLSALLREKKELPAALQAINQAIELAESTDFLYQYILRGELWAERWNLLHQMDRSEEAAAEAEARIAAYADIPVKHVSYLYYGYRFKAQLAAEQGLPPEAKDYMHKALQFIEIPAPYQKDIAAAFAQQHDNISWILHEIDLATPNPETVSWDI